jgi:hypothetical protein
MSDVLWPSYTPHPASKEIPCTEQRTRAGRQRLAYSNGGAKPLVLLSRT